MYLWLTLGQVREVAHSYAPEFPWQRLAFDALHEAAEAFLVHLLHDSNLISLHAKRVTLKKEDIALARRLKAFWFDDPTTNTR